MYLDNKGQSSAEVILLIDGMIVIVILVGSYITNMTKTTQNSFKTLLNKEKNYIINKN